MPAMYNCECQDGRTITGSARWDITELRQMNLLQLIQVLTDLQQYARYYSANFYYPIRSLEEEAYALESRFRRTKLLTIASGAATAVFTILWVILALFPILRFSGLTLVMAVMTFLSILLCIPMLFHYITVQESHSKRLPKVTSKLTKLRQKQDKEIFGTYLEYLIGGYILSPEYSLSNEALGLMIQSLRSGRVASLSEAVNICRSEIGESPVPSVITAMRSLHSRQPASHTPAAAKPAQKKIDLNQLGSSGPDLKVVVQLSEYLNAAVKSYAANQKAASNGSDSIADTLSVEEEALVAEFRTLGAEEQKRIRRVIHSFLTRKY